MESQIRYFRQSSDKDPNKNPWHGFRDDSADALCGTVRISYNRDSVRDSVPDGDKLHKACREAIAEEAKA